MATDADTSSGTWGTTTDCSIGSPSLNHSIPVMRPPFSRLWRRPTDRIASMIAVDSYEDAIGGWSRGRTVAADVGYRWMHPRPSLPDWHVAPVEAFSPDLAMVQRWLDAYVAAWQSYDEAAIADLWTEDAIWIYPFRVRAVGRSAITAEWMAEKHVFDGRGYDARYEPIAIDGDVAVTHGLTLFFDAATGAI